MNGYTRIKADVTLAGPLAIFSGESDALADRKAARNVYGDPLLEGTGLAGALKSAAAAIAGDTEAERLFGSLDDGPSKVVVHDPEVRVRGTRPEPEPRWRNVIGRDRLTALDEALFVDERWPSGMRYRFRIDAPMEDRSIVLRTLRALSLPGLGIGSGPTPIECRKIETALVPNPDAEHALATAHARWNGDWDRSAWADRSSDGWEWEDEPLGEALDVVYPEASQSQESERALIGLDIRLTWRLVEPLKTGQPLSPWESAPGEPDNEPFETRVFEGDHLVRRFGVAFSGIHGVIRQRAERFLSGIGARISNDPRLASDQAITHIFGSPGAGRDEPGNAGIVHASDFLAVGIGTRRVVRDRVAIDRLTGGTYRSSKWIESLVPAGTELSGTVSVRDHRLRSVPASAVAGVAAALRDIHAGRAAIGGGTSVGNGTVELVEATVETYWVDRHGTVTRHETPAAAQLEWPESLTNFVISSMEESEANV